MAGKKKGGGGVVWAVFFVSLLCVLHVHAWICGSEKPTCQFSLFTVTVRPATAFCLAAAF